MTPAPARRGDGAENGGHERRRGRSRQKGWYRDPYRVREDRWYADGTPTALVGDGEVEANDPPPPGDAPDEALVRSMPDEAVGPDRGASSAAAYADRAWEAAGETSWG